MAGILVLFLILHGILPLFHIVITYAIDFWCVTFLTYFQIFLYEELLHFIPCVVRIHWDDCITFLF